MLIARILLHLPGRTRRSVDPADIYYLEAEGDETLVRLRSKRRLRDVRSLGEVLPIFAKHGFVRIHGSFVVNPLWIRQIRPRKGSRDWELKMEPPVNVVLPISRARLRGLLRLFGDAP